MQAPTEYPFLFPRHLTKGNYFERQHNRGETEMLLSIPPIAVAEIKGKSHKFYLGLSHKGVKDPTTWAITCYLPE